MEPNTTSPGWKTSEFWLSLLAMIIGAVLASGALNPADPHQSQILQLAGLASMILAKLGYTASRGFVKASDAKAATLVAIASAAVETQAADPK